MLCSNFGANILNLHTLFHFKIYQTIVIMEELTADQNSLLEQIQSLKRNYSKTSLERRTSGYVSGKITSLIEIWRIFQENDRLLRREKNFSKYEYAIAKAYDNCEETVSLLKGDFEDRLLELNQPIHDPNIQPHNPNIVNPNPDPNHPPPNPFRLPQITIPTFSGDYASWTAFQDMFVSLIHSNTALSNVQKLYSI